MDVKETYYINDLYDLRDRCWSGALDRIDEAINNGVDKEFFDYIQEAFYGEDEPDITAINDFIWFECDDYLDELIHKDEDEENEG